MKMINHKSLRMFRYVIASFTLALLYLLFHSSSKSSSSSILVDPEFVQSAEKKVLEAHKQHKKIKSTGSCPNYVEYSTTPHGPYSEGPLQLPFQRPSVKCRTYTSQAVEKVIEDLKERIDDPDLARLFENCLPNTLDTTILWHKNGTDKPKKHKPLRSVEEQIANLAQTFIVTGDIHAEWLRDSAWQLSAYSDLIKYDQKLKDLFVGAINTQARYIIYDPYCNAFQPPPESKVDRENSAIDSVFPRPNWRNVFECKWELDSLASFLALTNQYYENTGDSSVFCTELWKNALKTLLIVLKRESQPTFNDNGIVLPFKYTFQRDTNIGSETLPLTGSGNPVNFNTKMVRSSFRPSDDACVFQLFVPANAFMLTQLSKLSVNLPKGFEDQLVEIKEFVKGINESIYEFGVVNHKEFGEVFAYEVDGYNSAIFMDDANIPSLLSLPDLGFIDKSSKLYQNTRKMVLSKKGNPYYLIGKYFQGIGGPHVGYKYAWPMSLCVKIRTSDDDEEITSDLQSLITSTGSLGLMHEGVSVQSASKGDYTRPWFAWCNSEFGKTILDLAKRKPHLIFKQEYKDQPYIIDEQFGAKSV